MESYHGFDLHFSDDYNVEHLFKCFLVTFFWVGENCLLILSVFFNWTISLFIIEL